MKGMPFSFQHQGVLEEAPTSFWNTTIINNKRNQQAESTAEPCSVLDHRRSPSPPTSTSTLSSSDTAGVAAISHQNNHNPTTPWPPSAAAGGGEDKNAEWASDFAAAADWDSIISDPPSHDHSFLHWIMADNLEQQQQHLLDLPPIDPAFCFDPPAPQSLPPLFFQEPPPPAFTHHDHALLLPPDPKHKGDTFTVPLLQPKQKGDAFTAPLPQLKQKGDAFTVPLLQAKPKGDAFTAQQQQQALVDQLFKAAELVEAGDAFGAREILARLNHQLPSSALGLSPLLRSSFLFINALHHLLSPSSSPLSNPLDVLLKLSSYKSFSEVSPLTHFTNFTLTQTLLEETAASDRIHIVDFDIGVGGHWSSFMHELANRRSPSVPSLKITAFVSPSSFHPLELHLIVDSLSSFASDLNIPFAFNLLTVDSFNPNVPVSPNEAIAVNLPVGSHHPQPFPTLLRMLRQLNPKIIVSADQGCNRGDLPFSHHFLRSLQSCTVLLDSLDAAGTNADVSNKIERLLLQPRIESAVLGRHRAAVKMPPWRASFGSAGFLPVQLSNYTETQAECLLKRVQVRGFHVEKRQGSLFLYWQRGELGSVSAWRCG